MARRRKPQRTESAAKKPAFVLDCSVVCAWYFVDEASDYADAVAASLSRSAAVAPSLWALEVANTLLMGERRKRGNEAQSAAFLADLSRLPIVLADQTTTAAWTGTLPLARSQNLSAYDAAYLELALRENLPLATLDERLAKAALALGIQRYTP